LAVLAASVCTPALNRVRAQPLALEQALRAQSQGLAKRPDLIGIQIGEHVAVDLAHLVIGFPQDRFPAFGDAGPKHALVVLARRPAYQPLPLEPRDDLLHPLPAAMSDLFPTNLRYSGVSLGYQFGGHQHRLTGRVREQDVALTVREGARISDPG
jgi:hypothetical protein